jgi:hypothetical protein
LSSLIATFYPFAADTGLTPVVVGNVASPRDYAIMGMNFREEVLLQYFEATGAEELQVFDRFTRRSTQALIAAKLHASLEDADLWVRTHTAGIPGKVTLEVSRNGRNLYLVGCGVPVREHLADQFTGLTTSFRYEIVGGVWQTTLPVGN